MRSSDPREPDSGMGVQAADLGPWPHAARPSIRTYLLGRLMLWLLPIVVLSMVLHWRIERDLLINLFDEQLIDRSAALASLVIVEDGAVVLEFADEFMPGFSADDPRYFFQVWLPSGATLERSASLGDGSLPRRVETLEQVRSFDTTSASGVRMHCVGIHFPGRTGGDPALTPHWIDVVVGARAEILGSTLAEGLFEVVRAGLLTVAAIAVAINLILRQGSLLLTGIADAVRSTGAERTDGSRPSRRVPRELEPIVEALDQSRARATETLEQERSFNANVAHELRTPISELRATTDVALQFRGEVDPYEALEEANQVSRRMGRTVEALLRLARLQQLEGGEAETPFDLSALVRASFAERAEPSSSERRVTLDLPEDCEIRSSSASWAILVGNLAANALVHAPAGAPVGVMLELVDDVVRLRVTNPAPGLTEDDLRHLTERLWRRGSTVASAASSGLGLSIAAATCRRIGASLSFELAEGELSATVVFPG